MSDELKILHLEDNDNDAELIRDELTSGGINYSYMRVDNEKDFVNSLLNNKYSLILSDFSLPHYNGLEAMEMAVTLQRDTPFIIVSGTLGEDAAVESMKKGATDYVLKNRMKKLVPTIIRAIDEVAERERRRKAEDRFGKLIEAARDVIYTLSQEGLITGLNEAFETITGWKRNDWIGKSFEELVHPDDFVFTKERFKGTLEGKIFDSYEVRFKRKDGEYLSGELLSTSLKYESGDQEVLGIVRDITERKKSEQIIRNSLREKDLLLKEIHHRVKNNLQIISSLLKMQSSYVDDDWLVEKFRETQNRVMSMSLIHQSFYQSTDLSEIDFDSYVKKLVDNLFNIYGVNQNLIEFEIDTGGNNIGIDTAIPCGLLINEIVSNSLKYAFTEGIRGKISLKVTKKDEHFILKIKDNGKGFTEELETSKTLGLMLIRMLSEQIDGKTTLRSDNGTEYEVVIPSKVYKDRLKDVGT
jgi:two-component system response regulator